MTMSDDRMALIEQSNGENLGRDMLAFAADRLMDSEVEVLTGRAHGVSPTASRTRALRTSLPYRSGRSTVTPAPPDERLAADVSRDLN